MLIIAFISLGLFIGASSGILFFRLDQAWSKGIGLASGNVGLAVVFFSVTRLLGVEKATEIELFSYYLITAVLMFFLTALFLANQLKKDQASSAYRLRRIDIFLGHRSLLEDYYNTRKREIDMRLDTEGYKRRASDIEKQMAVLEREKSQLSESRRDLEKVIDGANVVCLQLPKQANIPVTHEFVSLLPEYANSLLLFCKHLDKVLMDVAESCREDNLSPGNALKSHLFTLCCYTSVYLFDSKDVRVHFRLRQGDYYVKLISALGEELYEDNLHPIPCLSGMIYEAAKQKRSLIKSLNAESHVKAPHDHKWQEYITMVFDEYYQGGIPSISMGVSVKNRDMHKNLLFFLNHIKVEQVIEQKLNQIREFVDFDAAIKEISSEVA